ncbi:MAG: DUF917 domain-containing protein [Saprospiraceae bacterium]|nr:DUF917 domain-containing protein [Candidatus Opimibacter iunctus]
MTTLSHDDLKRLLDGATILGSGGGGPKSIGEQFLKYLLKQPPVSVIDPKELTKDQWVAVGAGVGSPLAAANNFPTDVPKMAFQSLEKTLSQQNPPINLMGVLPGEIGAGNTFVPLAIASQLKLPIVDASGARRAIPSLTQCTYAHLPISPIVLANKTTDVSFSADNAAEAEPIMRAIISSGTFTEDAGIAFWNMNGVTVQQNAVVNTLTYALELGKVLYSALQAKQDPVKAVVKYLKGYILFKGEIVDTTESTEGGFDFGTVVLRDKKKNIMTIYNQNENLIGWVSNKMHPVAIAPDLISYLTTDGITFSNADLGLAQGKEVVVIGSPSTAQLRSPAIMPAWTAALTSLGYAGQYVPIEEIWAKPK